MEERTKAADNYATTFFTKQLMYPQKKTRRCINWRNAKQSPLQRISSQPQGEHAEGGTFNDLHPAPLPAPSAQTHPARQPLEAHPRMFRSSNRWYTRRQSAELGSKCARWRRTRRAGSSGAGRRSAPAGLRFRACGSARADRANCAAAQRPLPAVDRGQCRARQGASSSSGRR